MKRLIVLSCMAAALFFGYKTGQNQDLTLETPLLAVQEEEYPVTMRKTFVFVVYGYNQGLWTKRALRSIFEQEYDYYRIVFIDDGSKDNTFESARDFIIESNQESKTLMIRNEETLGYATCLRLASQSLLDQEIVIPMEAKNWLLHSGVLTRMNGVFQNPDVWIASTRAISYPSYEIAPFGFEGFYAALFKQLGEPSQDKTRKGEPLPLEQVASGRVKQLNDALLFSNTASAN